MDGIEYPVVVNKIKRFENLNQHFSVNVFGYENEIYPVRITEHRGRQHHINLLLLCGENNTTHYCLIRNLSRLLASLTKRQNASVYCNYCLYRFSANKTLDAARKRCAEHEMYCSPHGAQKVKR